MRELIVRAKCDTRWFSLKADIGPGIVVALAIAIATYVQQHGGEKFKMSDITVPLIAGLVALVGYWAVVNGAEFIWNLTQAGNRIAIEHLRSRPPMEVANFPVDVSFATVSTWRQELGGNPVSPGAQRPSMGCVRLMNVRITNRSDKAVSVEFKARLLLPGLPTGYLHGFPAPRWYFFQDLFGRIDNGSELKQVENIPARESVLGDITFGFQGHLLDRVSDPSDSFWLAGSNLEVEEHVSKTRKSFPLVGL
jgi:hypothetical protein